MELSDPLALFVALAALPVLLLQFRRRRPAYRIPSSLPLAGLGPTLRTRLARALPMLRVIAILLLAVALARPRVGEANAVVPAEGIDIALAIDISSSMTTSQFGSGKNRLEVTKEVIREFIKGRKEDRIGLVVFQKDALALAPPSLDYEALDRIVSQVDSGLLPDGTGIGVGLATALNMLRESNATSRIAILLTDGQHNAPSISPGEAANLAAALHIRVYTIGVINARTGVASAEVDEQLLRDMAEKTGGQYFAADNPKALASVYEEIGKLETSRVGREHYERFTELAPWLAGAAALLFVVELLLGATWLRRAPS